MSLEPNAICCSASPRNSSSNERRQSDETHRSTR
jgi:hypothetical protein